MSEPLGAAIGRGPISEASPPQFLATNMETILSTVERGSNCHLPPVIKTCLILVTIVRRHYATGAPGEGCGNKVIYARLYLSLFKRSGFFYGE